MIYEEYLKDNTCFIVPNFVKREILSYISKNKLIIDICFFTIEELKKKIFFDYTEKSIYSLIKQYNLSYDDSLLMINNIYYLNEIDVDDNKYLKLKEIKQYLDSNNLLIYSNNFLNYINEKNIVTTYGKTTFLNEKIFSLLKNIKYIQNNNEELKSIYEFDFIEEEIEYVSFKIANLIENGTDINNIKLVNVNSEYVNSIKKIFNFYNIPVNLKENIYLYNLKIIKEFINFLKTNTKEEALILFKEKYDLNNSFNLKIYNQIIEVLNKCYFTNDLDFIIRIFKNTPLKEDKNKMCIECIKVEEMYNNDNYYFMIGFNSYFPKFYKDEDYLSDSLKEKLGFFTSSKINKNIKNYYINKLKSIPNLIITYKNKDYFNSYLPSTILSDICLELVKNPSIDINYTYASKFNEIKMAKELDSYYKYSIKSANLGILLNNYNKDSYNSYNNEFKNINSNNYLKMINNKLVLSYSSLDTYYKCSFKYYLNSILKENENEFASFIGNLYHYVLSKMYDSDFDFEKEYNYYLNTRELSDKENVLLIKLKEELRQNIKLLNEQIKISDFKKSVSEKKLSINIKSDISISLIGFIDKIMLDEEKKYAYVVDYKTGKPEISFDNLEYGIGMQLAIYMYLMNKSKEYADIFLFGCYLQKIIDDDINKEELKLEGYTFNDLNIINKIDHNSYEKSFIQGMKIKKNGELASTSKVFDSEYYNNILNIIEERINEAINGITQTKFNINPKIIKGKNISCKFCKYNDICYHSYKDNVIISGGEEDE